MNNRDKGVLVVLSGPSGAGKGTVLAQYLKNNPSDYFSVSATTREPREGEAEGVNYRFVKKDEFERLIRQNELLEYNLYVNNYYGTLAAPVREKIEDGHNVILEIDVNGGLLVKKKIEDAVLVFLVPPSFEELRKRLECRHTEADEIVSRRMETAALEYQRALEEYEFIVINDDIERAACELESIITAARCRVSARKEILRITK